LTLKINRVSDALKDFTKFGQNPLKGDDSSVHKDDTAGRTDGRKGINKYTKCTNKGKLRKTSNITTRYKKKIKQLKNVEKATFLNDKIPS